MNVGSIMNKEFIVLRKDDTIERAIDVIVHHCRTGLAVVDTEGYVCGFVSEEDIIKKCLPVYMTTLKNAAFLPDCGQFAARFQRIRKNKVSEIMNPKPVCILETDSDFKAASEMIRRHIKVCPVIDTEKHLMGYISRAYLIRSMILGRNSKNAIQYE
ncbi:MAG: CBS domain-containing protein [Synergistes sp.]|nr:CBS domain-containing protein [Synergistes sp.]